MKNLMLLLIPIVSFAGISCKKSHTKTVAPATVFPNDSMSFYVDGKFTTMKCKTFGFVVHLSLGQYYVDLEGVPDTCANYLSISAPTVFSLNYVDDGGTQYQIGTNTFSGNDFIITDSSGIHKKPLYGLLTIVSRTPHLNGTFYFTCTDSTKISSGFFNFVD